MDVRIGVTHTPRELDVELADDYKIDALKKEIEKAMGDSGGLLWLTDRRGKQIAVPSDKISYVEINSDAGEHRVGFTGAR